MLGPTANSVVIGPDARQVVIRDWLTNRPTTVVCYTASAFARQFLSACSV